MPVPAHRLFLGLILGCALLAAGLSAAPVSAQTSCDWAAYPDVCIPPVWEVGDLECWQLGATDFTVYPPDPHFFDDDYDGIGCESWAGDTDPSLAPSAAAPIAGSGCDPSYPELCLASAPDLDCADIGYALTVIHDPSIGAYDPHLLDEDYDGIGCESW